LQHKVSKIPFSLSTALAFDARQPDFLGYFRFLGDLRQIQNFHAHEKLVFGVVFLTDKWSIRSFTLPSEIMSASSSK